MEYRSYCSAFTVPLLREKIILDNAGAGFTASNASGSATSAAALLTVNPAPALSRIIFSRNNGTVNAEQYDLYSIYEDGTGEIQLTNAIGNEHVVAIAPGGRVIYQRTTGGQTDLYSVNADGTGTATLANTADFEIFAGITPSGRVIYRRDSAATGRDLYSVNADGSGAVALANTAGNDDFAGITPSGKVIYTVAGDLYSINADGTGKVALGADPAFYEDFKGVTPSGLVIVGTVDSNFFGSGSIYSISENGGTATTLATNTLAFEYDVASNGGVTASGVVVINRTLGLGLRDIYGSLGGGFVALATSPDYEQFYFATASGQIVYVRNPTTTRRDIYIVNADGSATTLLANSAANNNNFPVNVTSNKLIYASGSGSSSTNIGDLYSVNLDGTGTVPLANTVDYEEFKGITSGGRVIYQRTDSSNITYLYAVNIDGTGTTPLANSGGHALFVATTPSGKVLFRRQPGNADLYIVNADGTGMTPLANTGNDEFFEAIIP